MLIQIYSLTHPDDVRLLVGLGVEHIGVAPAGQGLRSELDHEQVKELFALMPPVSQSVALTVRADLDAIVAMAEELRPAIVHVCYATDAVSVDDQRRLRQMLPAGTKLMKAIEVGGPETAERAIAAAERYAAVSDFFILDTDDPAIPGIGAAGKVHDWDISAEIVRRVGEDVPVILAGGLDPDNVRDAIRHVRPAGVDSFSWTNDPHHSRRKDPERVRAFVANARRAAAELGL